MEGLQILPSYQLLIMTINNGTNRFPFHHEESLKAARRAEKERLWFAEEATNEELLKVYKFLDVKEE